ncbi:MAG TPA: hypothetical protein VG269_15510 [Tepidisphaeraceae bacterium]|jgi:WD40 repeat protein|nr:hypothetical protein [Tepidisphaeraceae bacterium]
MTTAQKSAYRRQRAARKILRRDRHSSCAIANLLVLTAIFLLPAIGYSQPTQPDDVQPRVVARFNDSSGQTVYFSLDGARLLTVGGKQARVWNVRTTMPMTDVLQHDKPVTAGTLSDDGTLVLTAVDSIAILWNADTGRQLATLKHDAQVTDVAISRDGKQLATSCDDKLAIIWDSATGRRLSELKHDNPVRTVTFSPDGGQLLTSTAENKATKSRGDACVWDIEHSARLWSFSERFEYCGGRPVFSRDGSRIAIPGRSGYVCEAKTGKRLAQWTFNSGIKGINIADFTDDGSKLLFAGDDGSDSVDAAVRLLQITSEVSTKPHLKQIRGILPNCEVMAAAISPDSRWIAAIPAGHPTSDSSGLWNTRTGKEVLAFFNDDDKASPSVPRERTVAFSRDGSYLAVGYAGTGDQVDSFTKLWRIK